MKTLFLPFTALLLFSCGETLENDPYEGEPCHNFIHKCKDPLTAWIRWRQGNKLLVDIYLMP